MSDQLALGKLTARSARLLNRFVGLGGVPAAINKTPQKRLLPTREQPDAPVREKTSQRLRSVRLCTTRLYQPGREAFAWVGAPAISRGLASARDELGQ